MKLSQTSDVALALGWRAKCIGEQVGDHGVEIEASVEAVGEGAEIAAGVFAELERLVRAGDRGLQVAQDGVDPVELGQFARLALADDDVGVGASGIDDAGKATQAVAHDVGARCQVRACPVGNGLEGETRHG